MTVASLPMYDWPEMREETDRLWVALRDALRGHGIVVPDTLDRTRAPQDIWTDPDLVLSQTCGMPWRLGLHREAQMIGTPDYGVSGCPPGYYCSAVVVREDDPRTALHEFREAPCAFNAPDSQSGYAAMLETCGGVDAFSQWIETGAHANSMIAVTKGTADIAAIDAVTWRIAERYLPEATGLRVLTRTMPTPGLPFITAKGQDASAIAEAVSAGIAALDTQTREVLGLVGFVRLPESAYLALQ